MANELFRINAEDFVPQLLSLSETIALKVDREGLKHLSAPEHVIADLFMMLRYAQQAFAFVCYLNADERILTDIYWREQYSVIGLISVRTLIDCLYTVGTIIRDPSTNGRRFRCSGLKKFLLNLEEEEAKYAGRPEWLEHFKTRRELIDRIGRETGVEPSEIKRSPIWKTLGGYLRDCYGRDDDFQSFLRGLTLGAWSDYSALAHASFEGMIPHGLYFARDVMPQENRYLVRENFPQFIAMHICRAAGVLLCLLTEVQARFGFDADRTARINQRLCELWDALSPAYEIKEFLDVRYAALMQQSGIKP